jgi:hypothetical protein
VLDEVPGGLHVALGGVVSEVLLEELFGLYTLLGDA